MFRGSDIHRLINNFGRTITYKVITEGVYNPATGKLTTTTTPYQVKGYFYDIRQEDEYDTFAQGGTRRLAINPHDLNGLPIPKPNTGDVAEGHRNTSTIYRVEEVMSRDKIICYILRVKG